jgi:hypothetical protein
MIYTFLVFVFDKHDHFVTFALLIILFFGAIASFFAGWSATLAADFCPDTNVTWAPSAPITLSGRSTFTSFVKTDPSQLPVWSTITCVMFITSFQNQLCEGVEQTVSPRPHKIDFTCRARSLHSHCRSPLR